MHHLFLIFVLGSLIACAPHQQGSPLDDLTPVSPAQSRLVVVSTPDSLDGVVTVDNELQRVLPQGGYTAFDLNPGYHRVEFQVPRVSHSTWLQTPSFPPGQTLYYSVYPSSSFRANRARALRLGLPIDDGPFLNDYGSNSLHFRKVSREEAAKIPRRW